MHRKRKEGKIDKDGKKKPLPYNQIAQVLTDMKIPVPGKAIKWHRSTVQRIMERTVVNIKGRDDI